MSAGGGFSPTQLPAPPGFGYLGETRAPGNYDFAYQANVVPQLPKPQDPNYLEEALAFPQGPGVPDLLRVHYGAADKAIVGDLLRIVEGSEPAQLRGITAELAQKYLTDWGYPSQMDAWTADEWASGLEAHSLDFNPLTLFNIGYPQ